VAADRRARPQWGGEFPADRCIARARVSATRARAFCRGGRSTGDAMGLRSCGRIVAAVINVRALFDGDGCASWRSASNDVSFVCVFSGSAFPEDCGCRSIFGGDPSDRMAKSGEPFGVERKDEREPFQSGLRDYQTHYARRGRRGQPMQTAAEWAAVLLQGFVGRARPLKRNVWMRGASSRVSRRDWALAGRTAALGDIGSRFQARTMVEGRCSANAGLESNRRWHDCWAIRCTPWSRS
jgi:hypothetical protein